MKPASDRRLLGEILKGVSRSFYLTIRVLPSGIRDPVAVAYLLARAADTIADTRALPPTQRLKRLLAFRERIAEPHRADFADDLAIGIREPDSGVSASESELLQNLPRLFDLLATLSEEDRERVQGVVATLTRGMELDLRTFPPEDSGELAALKTAEELDRYTYLVAGCVGEFWTLVSMSHQPRLARWDTELMTDLGVRFGKALQLTNVLRDVPRDLGNGRCYLPEEELARAGLSPADLLEQSSSQRALVVLRPWIRTALEHFKAAETYLLATPRRCFRLRLAALWPILLGLATLELLARNERWLDPARPSRVRRRWVYGMMLRSLLTAPSDRLLSRWIRRQHRRVEEALDGN